MKTSGEEAREDRGDEKGNKGTGRKEEKGEMDEKRWEQIKRELREVASRIEGCKYSDETFPDGNERVIIEVRRDRRDKK